jgi:hypothetical protein
VVSKQHLPKFDAHWYQSMFIPFAANPEHQVIEIHVDAAQVQHLLNPHSRIESGEGDHANAGFISTGGLAIHYPPDLFGAQSGK